MSTASERRDAELVLELDEEMKSDSYMDEKAIEARGLDPSAADLEPGTRPFRRNGHRARDRSP